MQDERNIPPVLPPDKTLEESMTAEQQAMVEYRNRFIDTCIEANRKGLKPRIEVGMGTKLVFARAFYDGVEYALNRLKEKTTK